MMKYYKFKSIFLFCIVIALFSNCKKKEVREESGLLSNYRNIAATFGQWHALGYGYDVTGDYLNTSSLRLMPVLDVARMYIDHPNKIFSIPTGGSTENYFYGASAFDYISEMNKKKNFNANISGGDKEITSENKFYFTGSLKLGSENLNRHEFSSRYSYATYQSIKVLNQIKFTPDVNLELLKNYLHPDFVNNVNTLNAETLVAWYGTHVLFDITLGGRLTFEYSSSVSNQTDTQTKKSEIEGGLGFWVKKFGINISSSKTQTEMTKSFNESMSKSFFANYVGGENGGQSITFDKDGNTSQTINISSWQSSVTPNNCAVVDIERMVPIYEFISDPVKKSEVKAAVEKYIADNQITVIPHISDGSIAFYGHHKYSDGTGHYISPNANENGYYPDGIAFRAFTTPKPGTQPVYEFWGQHNNKTYHFYQFGTSQTTFWHLTGIKFFAYPTQMNETVPVYGYTNPWGEDHFFTTDNLSGNYWVTKWGAFNVFPAKD